jgi:hypothetical protein
VELNPTLFHYKEMNPDLLPMFLTVLMKIIYLGIPFNIRCFANPAIHEIWANSLQKIGDISQTVHNFAEWLLSRLIGIITQKTHVSVF